MMSWSKERVGRPRPHGVWCETLRSSMRLLVSPLLMALSLGCVGGRIRRSQARGPDTNFEIVKKLLPALPAEKAARFRAAIARAKAIRPDSPEIGDFEARFAALAPVPYDQLPKTFTNSIGMKFVLIEAGEFEMGCSDGAPDERPVHRVRITRPFYLAAYEVSERQYGKMKGTDGRDLAQNMASWDDARAFREWLASEEGLSYRLPTEAEWEYACRAGTRTKYSFGDNWDKNTSRQPNPWGIYDMHGNVWEWCQDWYSRNYYRQSPAEDPKGPAGGASRVLRGGSWNTYPRGCRAAFRDSRGPATRTFSYGFRLLLRDF